MEMFKIFCCSSEQWDEFSQQQIFSKLKIEDLSYDQVGQILHELCKWIQFKILAVYRNKNVIKTNYLSRIIFSVIGTKDFKTCRWWIILNTFDGA